MKLLADFSPGSTLFFNHPGASSLAGDTLGTFITKLLPNVLALAGVIFFILILGGGFMMIKSAGSGGSPQDAAKAKAAVTYAIIGFLLVICSFFIMQIVGTLVGINFLGSGL